MSRDSTDSQVIRSSGSQNWLLRRLRSAAAWEEIRVRFPDGLPLPRGLLAARLLVVLGIIFFSLACVLVVWKLGPLRRAVLQRAGQDAVVLQLRSRLTTTTLSADLERFRDEVTWLRLRLDQLEKNAGDDQFREAEIASSMATFRSLTEGRKELDEAPAIIAALDDLAVKLRASEARLARDLDARFDLLTLLVVGALILSTATLLLMERTNRAKEKLAALRYRATHDHLTQGLNRGAIFNVAERELARSNRLDGSLAVLLVDLDKFKEINDTYGHAAGDEVIKQAAVTLRRNLRIYDSVGRYGGDEFLIVLPDADENEAGRIAERLCSSFQRPLDLGQVMKRISTSIGGAVHRRGDEQIDALIARADRALYQAKAAGRDGWAIEPAVGAEDGLTRLVASSERKTSFSTATAPEKSGLESREAEA